MGLFDKVKGFINEAKGQVTQQVIQRQEEAIRFNPHGKNLQWFSSEDGVKTFREYVTAQSYFLEESIKNEHQAKYPEYSFDVFVSAVHKNAKLPSVYFKKLADKINVQALKYVGPTNLLVDILCIQAKPFYIDDDEKPQPIEVPFTPEEIVSVNKNPVLIFANNFDCFELSDDAQGSWDNKWELWSSILIWLGVFSCSDKEIIPKNPWIFSKEVYFNDLDKVRTPKGFYKKCIELATDEKYKAHFERKYNECE